MGHDDIFATIFHADSQYQL